MKPETVIKHPDKKYLQAILGVFLLLSPALVTAMPFASRDHGYNIHRTTPEWILDKTVGNVEFYYAIIVCDGDKAVFLKFNNKNDHAVKITWKEVYGTKSSGKRDGFGGRKELLLKPGVTMPQSCSDEAKKKIVLLSSQVNPAAVTEIVDFSFKEITVTTL